VNAVNAEATEIGAVPDAEPDLPSGWRRVRLKDVTVEGTERNRDGEFDRTDVLGVDNQDGLGPSDRLLGDDFSRYKLVRRHQFAYNPMRLNVGSIGLWASDETAIVSPDYIVFGCRDDQLDPDFMDLFRRSAAWNAQIRQSGQGSVRIRYYYRHIGEFTVPLPPLGEQRAIAHVLRTVERARDGTEKVIGELRQLKHSLLRHLFLYGPVPFDQADRVPLQETGIGPTPAHWQMTTLGGVARIGNGSTPRRNVDGYWKGGTLPWLTSGKVHERCIRQADEFVTEQARAECHLPMVPKGSLVVAITGQGKTLGTAAQIDLDACVSQHLAYIQFRDERVLPEYVLAFLHTRYEAFRKVSNSGGSTKGALTCGFLKTYLLPVPPLTEQRRVVEMLNGVESKLDAELSFGTSLDTLLDNLLHQLLTGQVRVPNAAPEIV
jgi:type I restriction enzyme S subunit